MITRLSNCIAYFFYSKTIIPQDKIEVYAYGYEIAIMSIINWGTILLIMLITKTIVNTLLYICFLLILRHHLGGFHASTHWKCYIITVTLYVLLLLLLNLPSETILGEMSSIMLTISTIITVLFAPVEHPNNPMTNKAKYTHRKIGLVLVLLAIIITILLYSYDYYMPAFSISYAVFQASIMLFIEIIKQHKEVKKQ